MDEIEFGDSEPEDSFTAEAELDALQLALRLHAIRSELLELADEPALAAWEYLDAETQAVAFGMAEAVVVWLDREGLKVSA